VRYDLASWYCRFAHIFRAMLFDLQLLGKPDAAGNAGVIENRTLAAASGEEAVRAAGGGVKLDKAKGSAHEAAGDVKDAIRICRAHCCGPCFT
jgi:hypothetical protein